MTRNVDNPLIIPGARVKVFDSASFKNDKLTPLSKTVKPATVVCRYGKPRKVYVKDECELGPYPDLVDIIFDDQPERISKGHFTSGVELC